MKKYLLLICLIFAVTSEIMAIKKSGSVEIGIAKTYLSTKQILNQEYTKSKSALNIPTTLDNISASSTSLLT